MFKKTIWCCCFISLISLIPHGEAAGNIVRPINLFCGLQNNVAESLDAADKATFWEGIDNHWIDGIEINSLFCSYLDNGSKINNVLLSWSTSKWALLCYLVLLIILSYVVMFYNRLQRAKYEHFMHVKQQREKEEILKQEQMAKELQEVRIKQEQLQAELERKSRELSNIAMNVVYKNELLHKVRSEIMALKDNNGNRPATDQLRNIQKVIDEGLTDEQDWNFLETSFNGAHEDFFKKLKSDHLDLVPNDLKLCAYLRMNMSSKEIASLLNISLRGVEIRRYRLRKKLNLLHDKKLTEFLIQL